MLFKLPIMLLSNAPKYSPLCPNYVPIMLHKELGLLTTLLKHMTVLLEYLDLSISVAGHNKDLEGPTTPLVMPLKKKLGI